MKPDFHTLRAFLNTSAALEVRNMIPFHPGHEVPDLVNQTTNEVQVC